MNSHPPRTEPSAASRAGPGADRADAVVAAADAATSGDRGADAAPSAPAAAAPNTPPGPPPGPPPIPAPAGPAFGLSPRAWWIGAALVGAFSVASLTLAIYGQQRVKLLEQELVRRQQQSQDHAVEARALAKTAQELARAVETKLGVLEGRVAENSVQRSQIEELIQQLSRSRDENVLADVEAAIRVAVQQVAITGSAEPLIAALRQSDERLARINQPRIDRVRRALVRDLDRIKAVALTDIASLTIKLDEAVRLVDELPLLAQPERRIAPTAARRAPAASAPARGPSAPAAEAVDPLPDWVERAGELWSTFVDGVWGEVRALVRVTRIDNPEAMLVAPEQAWFLRENLKLRLLNARLALMSRQFETAQADLRDAQSVLERYFDRSSRRVAASSELVRQVAGQARQLSVPRPEESLAAIAAAQAGR